MASTYDSRLTLHLLFDNHALERELATITHPDFPLDPPKRPYHNLQVFSFLTTSQCLHIYKFTPYECKCQDVSRKEELYKLVFLLNADFDLMDPRPLHLYALCNHFLLTIIHPVQSQQMATPNIHNDLQNIPHANAHTIHHTNCHLHPPQPSQSHKSTASSHQKETVSVIGIPSVSIQNGELQVHIALIHQSRPWVTVLLEQSGCVIGARPEWAGKRLVAVKRMKKKWGGWDKCKRLKYIN
ncbi:hypothetical protein EV702DRAFT_1200396 [Suillus placidus]|uniref:Uncharacterized protein n=1 Tax=Suillus placidus TaxID=48579 RepID=A0A9P7D086_9AGAM|nr:hypothetical protein EV702DRAFT_1200396 [Suillus placidus]